ncbi:MAG TPA: DUF302 domain-containing protein [Solirubrobacteraceae bacterium]|nr:DUF302 domain-containing protein [Solirubrobacteraceae bacterium]
MTTAKSPRSVQETVQRALAALERRDIELFARIDHGAGAKDAGLELGDEKLLVFGDPRVGTLLMQRDRSIGYELPLRLLVWDADGQTMLGYRPPTELAGEYHLADRVEVQQRMGALMQQLVDEIVGE